MVVLGRIVVGKIVGIAAMFWRFKTERTTEVSTSGLAGIATKAGR